jgi:thioredoxin-related protein
MRKGLIICASIFILMAFKSHINKYPLSKVNWMTWEQAVNANKIKKKKIFIDVYTDWCGWCKVMDKETFANDTVVTYLNQNFYAVKLDAEQKEKIIFQNNTFEYVLPEEGNRGVHTLAYALLDGKMSYPTVVYLTEEFERIMVSPGYKQKTQLMKELIYSNEELYKTKSWDLYSKGQ